MENTLLSKTVLNCLANQKKLIIQTSWLSMGMYSYIMRHKEAHPFLCFYISKILPNLKALLLQNENCTHHVWCHAINIILYRDAQHTFQLEYDTSWFKNLFSDWTWASDPIYLDLRSMVITHSIDWMNRLKHITEVKLYIFFLDWLKIF